MSENSNGGGVSDVAGQPQIAAEGYRNPSAKRFNREADLVEYNDRGQDNSQSITDKSYHVTEETQIFGSNSSIQSVHLYVSGLNGPYTTDAGAILRSKQNGGSVQLIGQSDGNVWIRAQKSEDTSQWFTEDVTRSAASVGITAAGIRRTQQDIAADGEVSRVEQQRIIDMIARAKDAAGIR